MHYNARLHSFPLSRSDGWGISNLISMAGYTSFAVFLFFAIALIIPSGFSVGPVLLLLGSFVLLRKHPRTLDQQDRRMIVVLAAYFLLSWLINLIQGTGIREYDGPMRFALAIPPLLLLLEYPPSASAIWSGLALGGIGSGVFSGWQALMLAHERSEGFTNPIQYGNISFLLGILCLAGFGWARTQRRARLWNALLAAGGILGILGSVFTGSRGSWLGLPFCLVVLFIYYAPSLKKRHLATGAIAVAAGLTALYAIPRTDVKARIELAVSEANGYAEKHNANTSTGARLEMWRAGVMLIKEKPILGWSKQGYMDRVQVLIKEGKVAPVTGQHSHLHNEYIDAWVKHGIVGLVAVFILFFGPLALFFQQYRHGSEAARPYAVAGIMLSMCYITFGLTQAFLTHINGVMLYAFTLAILWAAARRSSTISQQLQGPA
jgi:O-antigen ligase